MTRKLRVEYPGTIYHVMKRGDYREPIFQDDDDWREFLRALAETSAKTTRAVQVYCLMGNHFHLVIETPQGNPAARWNKDELCKTLQKMTNMKEYRRCDGFYDKIKTTWKDRCRGWLGR